MTNEWAKKYLEIQRNEKRKAISKKCVNCTRHFPIKCNLQRIANHLQRCHNIYELTSLKRSKLEFLQNHFIILNNMTVHIICKQENCFQKEINILYIYIKLQKFLRNFFNFAHSTLEARILCQRIFLNCKINRDINMF